ncbi:MAG: tetratricopeptide repeat protein [Phycisphaerales bacterium]
MPVVRDPEPPPDTDTIGDAAVRSKFGFDQDETWLSVAGRAAAEPHLGRIGGYELLAEAGRGSQGSVYKAVQPGTGGRTVAIKRLGGGRFAPPGVRARFDREVRVLASLNHPGVVTVYGADEVEGHRFLLMEWIDGTPIDTWARTRAVRERLEAFTFVCDAVRHAHQRGVIHRDLKPTNILVDTSGRPRVLDFGLAKLREEEALEAGGPAWSRTTSFVGTPVYAAPEQVAGSPDAVDTRADVYALGAVLYQLLTGVPPIEPRGELPALFEAIRSVQPRRPSSLVPGLDRELDAIVLKALAKEPERRYPSVEALGDDVRRHLAGEAVHAHPPGAGYRLRKFARRHRAGMAAGAVVALAVVGGAAATGWQAFRALRAEAAAGRDRDVARTEARRAEAVRLFLTEMLAEARPGRARPGELTVRQVLDRAAARVGSGTLGDEPEVVAALRMTIGETYLSLGHYGEARESLDGAYTLLASLHGPAHRDTIAAANLLARAHTELADFARGEALHREALGAAIALHGGAHPQVARVLIDLGSCLERRGELEAAEAAHLRAMAILGALPGASPLGVAEARHHLGVVLGQRARLDEAEAFLREAMRLRRQHLPAGHLDLAATLDALSRHLYRRDVLDESEALLAEALAIYRGALDPLHPDLARCLGHMAMLLKMRGRNAEGIPLLREAVDVHTAMLGPAHPEVADSLLNLAHALGDEGMLDEGDREGRRALDIYRQAFGEHSLKFAYALHNVAVLQGRLGDQAGAERLLRSAAAIVDEELGRGNDTAAHMRDSLGVTLTRLARYEEARPILEEALATRLRTLGEAHPKVALTQSNLSLARLRTGDTAGAAEAAGAAIAPLRTMGGMPGHLSTALLVLAEARLRSGEAPDVAGIEAAVGEAMAVREAAFGRESWQCADAARVRGLLLSGAGRYDEGEASLLEALRTLDAAERVPVSELAETRRLTMDALVSLCESRGRPDQAAAWRARRAGGP